MGLLNLESNLLDEKSVKNNLEKLKLDYRGAKDALIFLNGKNITNEIREHYVSDAASKISQFSCVRDQLKAYQRELVKNNICVLEGRDIGTVVFPAAKLKVFLTASNEIRAKRRFADLENRGILGNLTLKQIQKDIEDRDTRDSNRDIAPLRPAEDAVTLNTDHLSISDVVNKISLLSEEIFK